MGKGEMRHDDLLLENLTPKHSVFAAVEHSKTG
jgi:hypothetical protein